MFFQCPTWKKNKLSETIVWWFAWDFKLFSKMPWWRVDGSIPTTRGVFRTAFWTAKTQPFSRLFLNSNSRGRFSLYVGFVMCLDCLHCPRGFKERLCWLMFFFFLRLWLGNYPEIYCYSRISICKMNGCTSLVIGFGIHFDGWSTFERVTQTLSTFKRSFNTGVHLKCEVPFR